MASVSEWSNADLRRIWREAGGEFYGPHVEHVDMVEAKFLPWFRALLTEHSQRVTELLEANNREVERRREAEAVAVSLAGVSYLEVLGWAVITFGQVAADQRERALRFIEEAVEVAHAAGLSADDLKKVADRVLSRKAGELPLEIAQASLTLGALAAKLGINLREAEAAEFSRIQAIPKEEFARRHAAKVELGIASDD